MRLKFALAALLLPAAVPGAAHANTFVVDDAEIVAPGYVELTAFTEGAFDRDTREGTAAGVEGEFGVVDGLEISASLPLGFSAPERGDPKFGINEAELGVKYRILDADGFQIAAYPSLLASIASCRHCNMPGATHVFLPVWVQYETGAWTFDGGTGYRTNPGRNGRDSWFLGASALKDLGHGFQLGAELFRETSGSRNEPGTTGYSAAADILASDSVRFQISVGSRISRGDLADGYTYSAALQWDI